MKAGIMAAGWGRRLGGGAKALTKVGGRALIDLTIEGLVDGGATGITCIVNERSMAVCEHVERAWPGIELEWIVRTTPSSMHSFLLVLERLAASDEPGYLMTTVDSVCRRGTARGFARTAASLESDLVLGVTDVIDDEKPLFAVARMPQRGMGDGREIMAGAPGPPFGLSALSSAAGASRYVTAGFYWASPAILAHKDEALSAGFTALRQFLGQVVARNDRCWAVPLPPVIDVDRPEDVAAAERLMSRGAPVAPASTEGLPLREGPM